jgi:hypothetical protein
MYKARNMSNEPVANVEESLNDFKKLESILATIRGDASKFYEKENNSAGTRLRKVLLEIKNLCHVSRKNIQETIKVRKDAKADAKTDAPTKVADAKPKKAKKPVSEKPVSEKPKKTKKAKAVQV